MNQELKMIFEKQHYKIVGIHSAVKTCHWLRKKLIDRRACYKETFYGIQSHRCLQMTPAINHCTQKCLYCWRYQNFTEQEMKNYDEPDFILEKSIHAHRQLISGFKGDKRCDKKMFNEASNPNQVAISLSGEPTIYPKLSELIDICHKNNMTTFVVSNGTMPEMIETIKPTQLYISISAPNNEIYEKICRPTIKDGWKKINRTIEILSTLNTRTAIRHTLIDNWNIMCEEEYAKLDMQAEPDFIECKAYMFVGYSRKRMKLEHMPTHEKIKKFAEKLSALTGYEIAGEKIDSRVVLLAKDKNKLVIS